MGSHSNCCCCIDGRAACRTSGRVSCLSLLSSSLPLRAFVWSNHRLRLWPDPIHFSTGHLDHPQQSRVLAAHQRRNGRISGELLCRNNRGRRRRWMSKSATMAAGDGAANLLSCFSLALRGTNRKIGPIQKVVGVFILHSVL